MPNFLREHAIEPNSRQRYAEVLRSHAIPYIGHRRVAEISRGRSTASSQSYEGRGRGAALHPVRADSALRDDADGSGPGIQEENPLRGIGLKGVPGKPIMVTSTQFQRVYDALPHKPAEVFVRLGVASGVPLCELTPFTPEDFNFDTDMLSVNKSTVRSQPNSPKGIGSSALLHQNETTQIQDRRGVSKWSRITSRTTASVRAS